MTTRGRLAIGVGLSVARDEEGGGVEARLSGPIVAAGRFDLGQVGQGPVELALEVADPEQAPDPAEQLDLVHRLGQEVVGPDLDAPLEVGGLVQGGDHQDQEVAGLRVGPELLADLEAGEPGHHHVEQEQVGAELGDDPQGVLAVDGRPDLAVDPAEVGLEQLDVLDVVVGDQDFRGTFGKIQGNASWYMATGCARRSSRLPSRDREPGQVRASRSRLAGRF